MKILIVDDNSDDLNLLRRIVEKNGHESIQARDGREGLQMAAAHRPDLIISDAMMPVMDGFMFLQKIKEDEELRGIPFIFYSANYQADKDVELAESMGACGYIFKPMDPRKLWKEIEKKLEQARHEEGLPAAGLKEDQQQYLAQYRDIIATKLEQKVVELEMALRLREEAEQKLREQSELLKNSLNALIHPFYVINAHDYSIALANKAAGFGENLNGETCFQLTHGRKEPCTGSDHPCALDMIKKSKESVVLEHIHFDESGKKRYVEIHGYPIFDADGEVRQIIEYCIDISARKQQNEERRRLTTVIEQVADSIVITDPNGSIQYVNPSFERITGYSKEEVIGKNPRIWKSEEQNGLFYKEMWDTLTCGKVWRGHLINRKKDGSFYQEEASITPVRNEAGKIINYVALKRDVTKQKQLEEHLQQAQKMEAIGTLAGGIAHDFNNILSPILGYAELVRDKLTEGGDIRRMLEQIISAGNRAKDLVKQILTFSRQSAQEPGPVAISQIVKEAVKLLRSSIPATITITDYINPEVGMVMADPTQIHQIVMNLCTNAYHAMRERGGELTVRLDCLSLEQNDSHVPSSVLSPGTYVKLEISDTGYGMEQQTVEKIFDPYFTTKEKGEGTGLGLAIVHGIVKNSKGHISVASERGKGTIFQVYLPQISMQPAASSAKNHEYPRGSERILIVDDEQTIAELLATMLKKLGYQVHFHTSSKELLQAFQNTPESYDLVITDMTMPEMTGKELSRELLSIRPDIPIILCTGYSELIDKERADAVGIKEYLMKPVTQSTLAEVVRKVLDGENVNCLQNQ